MQTLSTQEVVSRFVELMPAVMRGVMRTQKDDLFRGKVSLPQFIVLDLIFRYGSLKMSVLAIHIGVSLPAMSGLVDRLHKIGLVKRLFDKKDRRIIRIALTPKAENLVKKIREQRKAAVMSIFSKLDQKDRQHNEGGKGNVRIS